MKNNDRNTWYAPLSAQFQLIEEAMPLSRFAAIEAVLYLLSLTAPDADPTKAYLLFTQYQLIGTTQCSDIEHTLQQLDLNSDIIALKSIGRMTCENIERSVTMQFAHFPFNKWMRSDLSRKQSGHIHIRMKNEQRNGYAFGRSALKI